MDIMEAKELVVRAGKEVVASGLIARTWGNISCRIDDKQFVITPSGKPYETLTPDEIVLVNIEDCSYDGDIKPSSEKGIHAEAYKLRPEVNFVIHTHQKIASVVSALGLDINNVTGKSREVIGDNVPVGSYGLPGTGKLRKGVVEAMMRSDSKAVIMAHHGAVCMGTDYDDAFAVARELETVCDEFIRNKYEAVTGTVAEGLDAVASYVAEKFVKKASSVPEVAPCKSERDGEAFNISVIGGDGTLTRVDIKTGALISNGDSAPETTELHRQVYKKRKDVNYIVHTKTPDVVAVSKLGRTMKPLLDDFAQLCGATVRHAAFDANNTLKTSKKVVKKLKGRNAVLLDNNGALCVSGSEYDATAIEIVMDKGARTEVGARLFDIVKPISPIETRLMRFIYLKKYSKQAKD